MAKSEKATSAFDVTGIIPDKKTRKATEQKKSNPTDGIKRAYYLTEDVIKAINIKAANEDKTKNEIVSEALRAYLTDYLKKDE